MEENIFWPVSAGMKKMSWNNLREVTQGIDSINLNMSEARMQERANAINRHLRSVVRSQSYTPSKDDPHPPLTDAIINQAIAYARESLGETLGSSNSLVIDPRMGATQ